MKLLSYRPRESSAMPRLGTVLGEAVVDLALARDWVGRTQGVQLPAIPDSVTELIHAGPEAWTDVDRLIGLLADSMLPSRGAPGDCACVWPADAVLLTAPLPQPTSLRDFYAFEQHVVRANANRGRPVPEQWYQFPVFYFSNHNAIYGPDQPIPYPSSSKALDYELEVAAVIGKAGRNITVEQAEDHIFGFMIFNDWSARDVQRYEMQVGLGPAKGKDFASSCGPWIVTPDELADRQSGRPGVYDLAMTARVNGVERSSGNWRDLYYSFGEMIARASTDVWLLPGDVLGSGTVGTGCLLELTRGEGPWLQVGDVVELEIERLGVLRNPVGPIVYVSRHQAPSHRRIDSTDRG